ncbi:hypothetical protein EQG49_04465 [Periweissella cryptocerci]|uniref:Uncharacterized protein n=1 Tax=Periweissella cryptocerci TaxID=2506420 RepID=A0A4P6YSR5_9LACO|nr:CAP domain-containing protein [Periweissella cryptocerci]QBO35768.1 hypothetical protein EQG49_04465 [Periweissella cryptocerci]
MKKMVSMALLSVVALSTVMVSNEKPTEAATRYAQVSAKKMHKTVYHLKKANGSAVAIKGGKHARVLKSKKSVANKFHNKLYVTKQIKLKHGAKKVTYYYVSNLKKYVLKSQLAKGAPKAWYIKSSKNMAASASLANTNEWYTLYGFSGTKTGVKANMKHTEITDLKGSYKFSVYNKLTVVQGTKSVIYYQVSGKMSGYLPASALKFAPSSPKKEQSSGNKTTTTSSTNSNSTNNSTQSTNDSGNAQSNSSHSTDSDSTTGWLNVPKEYTQYTYTDKNDRSYKPAQAFIEGDGSVRELRYNLADGSQVVKYVDDYSSAHIFVEPHFKTSVDSAYQSYQVRNLDNSIVSPTGEYVGANGKITTLYFNKATTDGDDAIDLSNFTNGKYSKLDKDFSRTLKDRENGIELAEVIALNTHRSANGKTALINNQFLQKFAEMRAQKLTSAGHDDYETDMNKALISSGLALAAKQENSLWVDGFNRTKTDTQIAVSLVQQWTDSAPHEITQMGDYESVGFGVNIMTTGRIVSFADFGTFTAGTTLNLDDVFDF